MKFQGSTVIVFAFVAVAFFGLAAPGMTGETSPALNDARVQEVITMVKGGLSLDLLIVKINDIGNFPELSGSDLVALKGKGVSERALVRMVELEEPPMSPAPPEEPPPAMIPPPVEAPAAAEGPAAAQAPKAFLRVEIERPFMITYYEVALDGEVLAHKGKLWDGTSEPGQKLKRPSRIGRRKITQFTALETEVSPGAHEVAAGFAVTWVEDDSDDNDDWGEFAHEFYVNRGVRAIAEKDEHPGEWFEASTATCDVELGQTCVVKVLFEKRAPSAFGGLSNYSVSYKVEVE
ncbi:MAG: hypothetical protein K8R59_09215 [Thermoanaerobaculales bacterium]|nr:hypothetical protein [Thermoanaerobaculales bacterium]